MRFVPKPLTETADASRGRRDLRTRAKDFASVVLVLTLAYGVLGWIAGWLAARIPDAWETRVFGKVGVALDSGSDENAALVAAQELLGRLIEGERLRELDYRVCTIDLPEPNAVALPGGGIGLSSRLLEEVQTEEGLAFVLAHELAHHQNRDLLRGMGRQLVFKVCLAFVLDSDSVHALDSLAELGERSYSRQQERAADDFGFSLAARKVGASTNLLEFLRLVEGEGFGISGMTWAETHPDTRERIRRLEQRLSGAEDSE